MKRVGAWIAILFVLGGRPLAFGATNGPQALNYLKDLLQQNRKQLDQADDLLKKTISDPAAQKPGFEERAQKLAEQRKELVLRQEFLDRLVFRIDTRYKGDADLKAFLVAQVSDMAVVEASDAQGDASLWKFLTYLSIALKDQVERSENLASFIEGYMKFSSIRKPIKPEDYVSMRSYTNGKDSYSAKPVAREAVGDIVEQKLKQLPPEGTNTMKFEKQR